MESLSCKGCGRRICAKDDRCPYCDYPHLSGANARHHWKVHLLIDFAELLLSVLAEAGGIFISIGLAVLLYSGGIFFLIVRRRTNLDIEGPDNLEGPDDPNDNPPCYDNPPRWLVRTD